LASRFAIAIVVVVVIVIIGAAVFFLVPYSTGPTGPTTGGTTNSGSGSKGQIAVMGTDPVTSGGGHEYDHYNNVAAHETNSVAQTATTTSTATQSSSPSSGWVMLNSSGWLELDALVNSSETIALASVSAGSYNAVRLYIDAAEVTYNGQNYTATVNGNGQITASLTGNAGVSSSSTTVLIFDLSTVAVNAGSSASPQFVITSSARAEVVPSGDVTTASLHVGAKSELATAAWFQAFAQGNAHLQISSASISSTSMNVTVEDAGSEAANVTLVVVTPVAASGSSQLTFPASLQGSAVLVVGPSGSLTATSSLLAQVESPGSGLSVTSSSTATLAFGAAQFTGTLGVQVGVQAGSTYLITVIGTGTVASTTVNAT
jgi:hypothetical protein